MQSCFYRRFQFHFRNRSTMIQLGHVLLCGSRGYFADQAFIMWSENDSLAQKMSDSGWNQNKNVWNWSRQILDGGFFRFFGFHLFYSIHFFKIFRCQTWIINLVISSAQSIIFSIPPPALHHIYFIRLATLPRFTRLWYNPTVCWCRFSVYASVKTNAFTHELEQVGLTKEYFKKKYK